MKWILGHLLFDKFLAPAFPIQQLSEIKIHLLISKTYKDGKLALMSIFTPACPMGFSPILLSKITQF